ncbi:MAG: peptidoglycan-binding domain-containing protein [Candidatus Zixiibacteriota bacterium]
MAQTVSATTADVLIAFQTRAGVDDDAIIKAGNATIKGQTGLIKPQGKGYYGLKIEPGKSVVLQLFGTDYTVSYQEADEKEKADKNCFALTGWKVTGDKTKLMGAQRRLQLLGYYYNGRVDDKGGKLTEYAALNFQADQKLRTDGEIGPKTKDKLEEICENNNKSGSTYIIRRTMLSFDWAPHASNAEAIGGWPKDSTPLIDDRGYAKVKSDDIDLHGPVVCVQRKTEFRIKVIREFIDPFAMLVASSDDESLVVVKSPNPLPNGQKFILKLEAKDPGNSPKSTSVRIKYKSGKNEYEVGSLQVIVMPLKVVKVRVYWVTIKDAGGTSITPAGTPAGSANAAHVQALAEFKESFIMVKALTRHMWRHYGIYLKFLPDRSKTVTLGTAGRVSSPHKTDFDSIINANDDAGNASSKTEINVCVVHSIENYLGLGYDAVDFTWPNGVLSVKHANVLESAHVMAHEIGHFLSLANCIGAKKYIHADDDPDSNHKKKDLWSVAKMMYAYVNHTRPYNLGFGYKKTGKKVTIRNLPSDPTDNEVYNANKWARDPNFYCKP